MVQQQWSLMKLMDQSEKGKKQILSLLKRYLPIRIYHIHLGVTLSKQLSFRAIFKTHDFAKTITCYSNYWSLHYK